MPWCACLSWISSSLPSPSLIAFLHQTESGEVTFFGLRDFYGLVKQLCRDAGDGVKSAPSEHVRGP